MASSDPNEDSAHEMPKFDYRATRRDFMLKLGLGINAVAGALVGIPIIGFFVSTAVQKQGRTSASLGSIDQFPQQATRMPVFINPYRNHPHRHTPQIPSSVKRPS